MNFKTIITIFTLIFIIAGCGVKSDPKVPKDTIIPSYESTFMNPPADGEKDKKEDE